MSDRPTINWEAFKGDCTPDPQRIQGLPPPPPWRQFRTPIDESEELTEEQKAYREKINAYWQQVQMKAEADENRRDRQRGESFRIRKDQAKVIQAVNAALALRRPLLITGRPGSGKTSLAYAIAYELQLGSVLTWPITARTTLEAGLYRYDAIARLQDAQLRKQRTESGGGSGASQNPNDTLEKTIPEKTIGDYIQLGPLGTAFLPAPYPRVLLIDEVDKSDINLPNDLLNLLEEGQFEIVELVRLAESQETETAQQPTAQPIQVRTADDLKVEIEGGKIRCDAFPLIVMTSNGERDFPPAFLRRCLRVEMPKPTKDDLYSIVEAHLTKEMADRIDALIERFDEKTNAEAVQLATDQLLQAVYLCKYGAEVEKDSELEQLLWAALTNIGG